MKNLRKGTCFWGAVSSTWLWFGFRSVTHSLGCHRESQSSEVLFIPYFAPQSRQMLKASQSFPCSGTLFKTKHDEIESSWIQTSYTLQAAIAAFHSLVKRKLGHAHPCFRDEMCGINQLNGQPCILHHLFPRSQKMLMMPPKLSIEKAGTSIEKEHAM